jgi:glucose/mannose-6-phosphate isomerase
MMNLDDLSVYKKIDTLDMLGQLYGLPQQCQEAWQKALEFKLPEDYKDIDKIVILGMGGSAIAGDLLKSLLSRAIKQCIHVNREYTVPSFIDEKTLVIACSYSGNTEETLAAFNKILEQKCKKLAITGGGKLKKIAESAQVPVFVIEHRSPPRAALGYGLMPLIAFLRNLDVIKTKMFDIPAMIDTLNQLMASWRLEISQQSNIAKKIALGIHGKITIIYGDELIGEAGHRWKTQMNENAKSWAFYEMLPELNHNSVVGYQFPPEIAPMLYVVFLRTANANDRTLFRYQLTSELLQRNKIDFTVVDAAGGDNLSRLMSMVYLGDWVSYYLAILNEIDPTPVTAIDYLKEMLSKYQS